MTRQGLIDQAMKPPFILGSECTGIISEVGEKVTTYKVMWKVFHYFYE